MNSITRWFRETFGKEAEVGIVDVPGVTDEKEWWKALSDAYVRDLAFYSCVNIVVRAVSKCEFKTYVDNAETKGEEYYLWNYSPNLNQGSSEFIQKWIVQLYLHNEALVVDVDGQLLVADSYNRKEYALYDDIFSGVTVGDFTFNRSFTQSEVLFFKLSSKDMKNVTDGLSAAFGHLIDYSMGFYKRSRGSHGVLNADSIFGGDPEKAKKFQQNITRQFDRFYNAENAVIGIPKGYTYADISQKTYTNEGTRDIRAMIDDVSDFTARAFSIPPALLNGKVEGTEQAMEHFLTFCVDPLCDMLQEEITRKRYGYEGFRKGAYLKIDTKGIKHIDLLDVAVSIDKLIASGAFCVNDIRKFVGEMPIDEDWANQHFMTKNYATVSDLLEAMGTEGGKQLEE